MSCAIPRTVCQIRSWKRPVDCTTFETRAVSGGSKTEEKPYSGKSLLLDLSRQKTLREMLDEFDRQFRKALMGVTATDPLYEFLVARNEFRQEEEGVKPFDYSGNHLHEVKKLF